MPQKSRRSIKIPKVLCGQCKLEVREEEEESIQCDKCEKTYHSLCSMLDKRQYKHLMDNESEEYICHLCNESGGNIKNELMLIKTKLNKLDQLVESMTFMSRQFDEILKGIAENKKKLDVVQKENNALKTELNDLKKTVKILNDNRVKNDCLVSGVESDDKTSAADVMITAMKNIGVDLKAEEIDDAYFLKSNNSKKNMVVKFVSIKSKQKIMSAKPKLRDNEAMKNVFVNDFLSKETLTLLNHAKTLKTVGYRRVYATSGRVYVKKSELSKPKLIRNAEEVDDILLEATTNRSRSRRSTNLAAVNVGESNESDGENDVQYLSPS